MTMKNIKKVRLGTTIELMLIACSISFAFSSCVSLKTPDRSDLIALNAPMPIGKFPVRVNRTLRSFSIDRQKDTVGAMPIWYFFKSPGDADSAELTRATHMELALTDETHVTSRLYQDDVLLKTGVIKGRLRKGYFKKEHDLLLTGVPPFYW